MHESADLLPFIDLAAQQEALRGDIERAIARVLDHGQYIMGPEVFELERQLAEYSGAKEVVSCSSGTDALWLSLLAWEVGPGDAVFLPSFTFTATAEAVALVGAMPVLVDVRADTFNLDASSLQAAIDLVSREGSLRPCGIIAVDLFGQPAAYDEIRALARRAQLWVLADAAQSFGGALGNRRVGTLADATATSFFPSKPLGCYGDGGAIFTDDIDFAERLRSIRIHGRGSRGKYDNIRVGTNARLDTIQAAILLVKLTVFAQELEARERIAAKYNQGLNHLAQVPVMAASVRSAWAQYTIQSDLRNKLRAALTKRGLPSNIYYPKCLHEQAPFVDCPTSPGGLAVSEDLSHRVLSLMMHPYLTTEVQQRILVTIQDEIQEARTEA